MSVCPFVTIVSPEKTDEPIEMLFRGLTRGRAQNLYPVQSRSQGRWVILGVVCPIEKHWEYLLQCTKTADDDVIFIKIL